MTGVTYSISLDDVDLALLPLRTHRFNEFLKKEHFHFQVIKKDNVEESSPTILYKCHICAIEVPAAFASEHRASIKHEANARIASEAAVRTRALISALPPPSTEQPNARFCANCSTTVSKNHDKTKEHRVAVMHDKLLWELMTAYVGDHNDDMISDDLDFNDSEFQRKDNRETNGYTKSGIKKHEENDSEIPKCDEKSVVNTENTNDKKGDLIIVEKLGEYEKKERKKVSFDDDTESYFEVNDCKQHHILEPVEHNGELFDVEFAEEHNDDTEVEFNIKKASRKVENGNNESNNNITYPIGGVSKIGIEIENNTGYDQDIVTPQIAKYTPTHNTVDYVEFITNNKQIKINSDNYHSFIRKDNKIKCIVCSSTVRCDKADSHVFSVEHLNRIPITSINKYYVRKINKVYSHCILCNQKIKTANVAKHVITFAHGERERQASVNTSKCLNHKETAKIEVKKPANLHMKLKTAVPDADKVKMQTKNLEQKAKSAGGVIKKLYSKDTASFSEEKAKNIWNGEFKPENDWPVIYPYEMVNDDCVRCVICDCKVPNHPDNRKSHLIGSNHAKCVAKRRLSHTIQESKQPTEPSWRCPICECVTPNNRKSRRAHIFGHHVNNMEKVFGFL